MKAVRHAKIKVMLAGEGSDELFGGYQYYYAAYFKACEEEPARLASEVRAYAKLHNLSMEAHDDAYQHFTAQLSTQKVFAPDGTAPVSHHLHPERLMHLKPLASIPSPFTSPLHQRMFEDLYAKKLPKLLHFQDRAAMASGIEARVPFLNHHLAHLMYRLPSSTKIHQGINKRILRDLLKECYDYTEPKALKHYVATPQREWLKTPAIRDEILQTLRYGEAMKQKWIDFDRFEKAYHDYSRTPELGNSFFIWKLINLEYFLLHFGA